MEVVKIGNVELTRKEAERLYLDKRYIVTYSSVYAIRFSTAQNQFYGRKLYTERSAGFAHRNRFYALLASDVNKLIGFNLIKD